MLRELSLGARSVSELAEPHPMTLAAASKHIRVLEKAGLVRREICWRTHVCHLEAAPLRQAMNELAYFERFWTDRLDALERILSHEDAQAKSAEHQASSTEGE